MKLRIDVRALILCALALPWGAHAQSYNKTETIEYQDDLSLWVLGQVKRTTTNGIETSRTEFGWKALPSKTYSFGKLQQTLSYETTLATQVGTLKTITDGNNNVTTFASWKRGIPQKITYADGKFKSAVVNDLGQISSVTDENGHVTSYAYDLMGRLNKITYPTADSTAWNVTDLAFVPVAATEYGLPSGHWKQTVNTGNGRKEIYFDALWRPVLERQYDAGNGANTLSEVVRRYDAEGRVIFQSYPTRGVTDINN